MSRVVVVMPTYNEAENLELLVPEVLAQDPRIELLVVDDDSPDGTGKIADDLAEQSSGRVHVLHREEKQGLGPAYRAGLRKALDLGADYVVQMDADFSHPPTTLPILLKEIESCDVVLGSRYLKGITVVNWPIERILLSYFGNLYVRVVTGMTISDTTGGFRCVRRDLVGDNTLTHVFCVRESEMLLWCHVTEHVGAVPADHCSTDCACDMVVSRRDIRHQRPQGVERCLVAQLLRPPDVHLDLMHRDVTGAFDHHLHIPRPGALGEFA